MLNYVVGAVGLFFGLSLGIAGIAFNDVILAGIGGLLVVAALYLVDTEIRYQRQAKKHR